MTISVHFSAKQRRPFRLSNLPNTISSGIDENPKAAFTPTLHESHWFREPRVASSFAKHTLTLANLSSTPVSMIFHGTSDGREATGIRLLQLFHRLKDPGHHPKRSFGFRVKAAADYLRHQFPMIGIEQSAEMSQRARQEAYVDVPVDLSEFTTLRNSLSSESDRGLLDRLCRRVFRHEVSNGQRFIMTRPPLRQSFCDFRQGDLLEHAKSMPEGVGVVVSRNSSSYLGAPTDAISKPTPKQLDAYHKAHPQLFRTYLDLVGQKLIPGGLLFLGTAEIGQLFFDGAEHGYQKVLSDQNLNFVAPHIIEEFVGRSTQVPMVLAKKA